MLNIKTTKTYSEAIRHKYLSDKESGKLRGEIFKLTPASIRKLCLNLIAENLSQSDKTVIKNAFETNDFNIIRKEIKKYDIDGFRPICKFLKKENDSIASHDALELIAILIDFHPRPYTKYKNEDLNKEEIIASDEDKSDTIEYINDFNDGKSTIIIKPKNKRLFAWFSNASASNKLKLFSISMIAFIIITVTTIHVLKNQTRWMVWQNDHYIEVKLNVEEYNISQLKVYKEDRILYFKQTTPDCNTKFFKSDGSENLWYGKNAKGELEYFTDLGLHPGTGKTLKKISKHMIRTHICESY